MRFGDRLRQERRRRLLSQEALAEALGCDPKSIRRWEHHQAFPQFSSRLQISRFFGLPPNELFAELKESAPPAFLRHVPYPRNPFFTGREEILQHLHEHLNRLSALTLTQSLAVSGLGGSAKPRSRWNMPINIARTIALSSGAVPRPRRPCWRIWR